MTFATTLSRVAALCLLAGAAHALPVPVADSSAPVPATVYAPAAGYVPAAPEPAGPAQVWREQNRIVAGGDAMPAMDAHAGHGAMHDHAAMQGAAQVKTAAAPATIAAAMSMKTASAMQCGGGGESCCKDDMLLQGRRRRARMICCAKGDGAAAQSCAPATATATAGSRGCTCPRRPPAWWTPLMPGRISLKSGGALAALLLVGGCAGVTPDGGFDAVASSAQARAGLAPRIVLNEADARAVAETTRALLAQPLSRTRRCASPC